MSTQVTQPGHLACPAAPISTVFRDLRRELCCSPCPYLGLLVAPVTMQPRPSPALDLCELLRSGSPRTRGPRRSR